MALTQFDERTAWSDGGALSMDNGTNPIQLTSSRDVDTRIDMFWVSNYEAVDHYVNVGITVGGQVRPLGTVLLPAHPASGLASTVEALSAILPSGQTGLVLPPGWQMYVQLDVALLTDGALVAEALGGYF